MDGARERDSIPPPSKERRWDIDERGEGIADATRLAPRIAELEGMARAPLWVTEQPELHLWPHLERAIREAGSPWSAAEYSIDADGCLVVDLVHAPVEGDRARAVLRGELLRLLGLVVESATYLEIVEDLRDGTLMVDVLTGVLDDQSEFKGHGHTLRFRARME